MRASSDVAVMRVREGGEARQHEARVGYREPEEAAANQPAIASICASL